MKDGVKYDENKLDYTLIPMDSLAKVVEVLMYGARKYAPDNWYKVPDGKRRYIRALLRHSMQAIDEDLDDESNLPHLAHAACCCLFALHFMDKTDDVVERWTVHGTCVTCGNIEGECICPVC